MPTHFFSLLLQTLRGKTLTAVQVTMVMGALSICGALPLHAAPAKSPPDSFAPAPAPTVEALLGQVQTNLQMRSRYAHYFKIPASHVAPYLRANLVIRRLKGDATYTMSCVHPNGLVYPTEIMLPQGSRVFALRNGSTVLTCPEGNPLVLFREVVETHILPRSSSQKSSEVPLHRVAVPSPPREIIVPTYVPTPVYQSVSPLTPAEQAAEAAPPALPPTPAKP